MTVWLIVGGVIYLALVILGLAIANMAARGDGRFDEPREVPQRHMKVVR